MVGSHHNLRNCKRVRAPRRLRITVPPPSCAWFPGSLQPPVCQAIAPPPRPTSPKSLLPQLSSNTNLGWADTSTPSKSCKVPMLLLKKGGSCRALKLSLEEAPRLCSQESLGMRGVRGTSASVSAPDFPQHCWRTPIFWLTYQKYYFQWK